MTNHALCSCSKLCPVLGCVAHSRPTTVASPALLCPLLFHSRSWSSVPRQGYLLAVLLSGLVWVAPTCRRTAVVVSNAGESTGVVFISYGVVPRLLVRSWRRGLGSISRLKVSRVSFVVPSTSFLTASGPFCFASSVISNAETICSTSPSVENLGRSHL